MMKKLLCFMLILSLCGFVVGCSDNTGGNGNEIKDSSTYLVKDGSSDYKIIIPEKATETEEFAANELATFFGRCVGREIDIVSDNAVTTDFNGKYLSVGDTVFYEKSGMQLDRKQLGTDGYKILTKDNTVIMNAAGENGKMYSVYEFLDKNLGVRFYAADEIRTPNAGNVYLKLFNLTDVPDFKGRDVHYFSFFYNTNPNFAPRMRTTSRRTVFSSENGEGSPWSSLWAHEQFKILPHAKYGQDHPEWYVMKDGAYNSLCWTNEEVMQEFVENLKVFITEQSDKIFFSISQQDGAIPCGCDKCTASNNKYTHAGTLMRFNNVIAKDIKEWIASDYPDREVYLVSYAYQDTIAAPVKRDSQGAIILGSDGKAQPIDPSVVAEDNIVIRYAPLYNCFSHDFMDETCNEQVSHMSTYAAKPKDTIIGWSAIAKHLAAWSYCTGFRSYLVNFNNFSTIQQNYRTMKEYGFIDVLDQGPADTTGTAFESLRVYLQSQLMWDVDRDFNALVSDFMKNYYKSAADEMMEYYELIRLHYAYLEQISDITTGMHTIPSASFSWRIVDRAYFSRDIIEKFENILTRALSKANAESNAEIREKLVRRIEAETLSYRYLQLELYAGYYNQLETGRLENMIDTFVTIANASGLTAYGESAPIEEKIKGWRESL